MEKKKNVKLCSTLLMTDAYCIKKFYLYKKIAELYTNFIFLTNVFICGWLHLSNISGLKPTPVVQSSSCTHPPLTLVHSRRRGALHLHADVSHFLRVKWTHHHHVYVTKLISPNILQTNPWRPRLCTWKSHGQVWNQHDGCWHSRILAVFSVCCN